METIILAETINEYGTTKKQVVIDEYQGKRSIKVREMWKNSEDEEWRYNKRLVWFNRHEFEQMLEQLDVYLNANGGIKEAILSKL